MKMYEVMGKEPKITNVRPGVSAEIDNGDGTKTVVDLKKNPNALVKDPTTKKTKLVKKTNTQSQDPKSNPKPGDKVVVDETQ